MCFVRINSLWLLHRLDSYLLGLLKTRAKGDRIFCFMLHEQFFFIIIIIRCIMKMDHHCPWINNCCGHQNHASFTLFLLLAPLGCIHAAFIFVMTMYTQLYNRVSRRRDTLPFLPESVICQAYWRSPFWKYTCCDLANTTALPDVSVSSSFYKWGKIVLFWKPIF